MIDQAVIDRMISPLSRPLQPRYVGAGQFERAGVPPGAPELPEWEPGTCRWCGWRLSGRSKVQCSRYCAVRFEVFWSRDRFSRMILRRDDYTCQLCLARPTVLARRYVVNEAAVARQLRRLNEGRSLPTPVTRAEVIRWYPLQVYRSAAGPEASQRWLPDITRLHVDHILPVSKDGLATWDNCRVLCRRCNLARGNDEDWKPAED